MMRDQMRRSSGSQMQQPSIDTASVNSKANGILQQELAAIQKIREKQKKEIEQMIDYELRT